MERKLWVSLQLLSKIITTSLLSLLCNTLLLPQNFVSDVSKVGTTAAAILDIPNSARSLAMGNAVSGSINDASVLHWNPAAIASSKHISFSFSYIPYLVETQFQHFSCVLPLQQQLVFGAYISTWSMDDMPVRTEIEQGGTGEYFNAADLVASIVLARQLTDHFAIGFTAKYIQERIWHSVAKGVALDFGTLYSTDVLGGLKIIAVLTNYGTDMKMTGRDGDVISDPDPTAEGNNGLIPAKYSTDWWSLPLNFRFGLSSTIIDKKSIKVITEIDALHPSNNYESIDFGTEIILVDLIYLRFGYNSLLQKDSIEGLSIGAGVKLGLTTGAFNIDYGYRDYGSLGYLHAITASTTL